MEVDVDGLGIWSGGMGKRNEAVNGREGGRF
jgi:hypothetical protein